MPQAEQALVIPDRSGISCYQAVAIPLADVHVHVELPQALSQPCFLTQQVRRSRLVVFGLLLVDGELQILPILCPYVIQGRCCACIQVLSSSAPLQVVQIHSDEQV